MTGLQEIISKRLDEDAVAFVRREHAEGLTYGDLIRVIYRRTGIKLSQGTVGAWVRGER